ncbi:MAG: RNA polymerase sigma factor [Myxococcota bacterium]
MRLGGDELEAAGVSDDEGLDDVLDLVVRLRVGERSALAEAYDRHHETVRGFARKLLGDADAAEDLVHDAFLALPGAVARFEGRSSLRTFLLGIAVRLCHKHIRAATRLRSARDRIARREVAAEVPLPSAAGQRAELADALARALDTLAVDQRVAFTLCVLDERTSREAAAILGVNEVTVRTRLTRAREKLRAHLTARGMP